MKKTLLTELQKLLAISGSTYIYNQTGNTISIGNMIWELVPTENPASIYGYDWCVAVIDEQDELPQDKSLDAMRAINERTRVRLPDGRSPFIVSATTAQGYKGVYQWLQKLQADGIPYIRIRGRTIDNTAIDKSYYDSLYRIYDENERRAYLDGEFVNLTAGRVYPDYDEEQHTCAPFHVSLDDHIYIGQDLNKGFSRGVAVVKRDKILYIVNSWSFTNIGNSPRIIRNSYYTQDITEFPDSSGGEILAGYAQEFREHNIRLQIGTANPSILERIFILNKMFKTGQLKVFKNILGVSMALKTRQYDKNGEPEKPGGEKDPSHYADSVEYVIYRLVMSDKDFFNIWSLTRSGRLSKA